METLIASFYPPLSGRQPFPGLYAPACFILSVLPFLIANKRLAITLTLPPLLILCLRAPYYTFSDPSSDYYNSGPFLAIPLWYLDFVLLTPREGEGAPLFAGGLRGGKSKAQAWTDLSTLLSRLKWAFRLMLPAHRGIGWNWQVKGVPKDPYSKLPKWKYVGVHVGWTVFYYGQSVVMLVILGYGSALRDQTTSSNHWKVMLMNSIIGWSGAIWVWDRLQCAYSMAAVLSAALGVCNTWEWPPLMGSLKEAWSVRQMWRYEQSRSLAKHEYTNVKTIQCGISSSVSKGMLQSRTIILG
jgi:hypothetical protein